MNIVLKPAGILTVLVIIAVLAWLVVSDQARLLFAPAGPDAAQGFVKSPERTVPSTPGARATPGGTAFTSRSTGSVDLTRMGKTDWIIYGAIPGTLPTQSAVRKNTQTPAIAPVDLVGKAQISAYGNDIRAFRWTDGASTSAVGTDVRTGIVSVGLGSGYRVVIAPTLQKKQTLLVWVGGSGVRSKLQARMSDGSALSGVEESYTEVVGGFRSLYTITFCATKPNQKLILSYLVAEEKKGTAVPTNSAVSLQAIALN